jgi:hypothetical protein
LLFFEQIQKLVRRSWKNGAILKTIFLAGNYHVVDIFTGEDHFQYLTVYKIAINKHGRWLVESSKNPL